MVTYYGGCDHGILFENGSNAYCWDNNRFITIADGVVNSLKYHTITDWSSATGMFTCS